MPVPKPMCLVQQRLSDHGGGVGAARLEGGRHHNVGVEAAGAAYAPRPQHHGGAAMGADRARPPESPPGQAAAASRAGHGASGEVFLGQLGGAGNDHRGAQLSSLISVIYHSGIAGVLNSCWRQPISAPGVTADDDQRPTVTIHTSAMARRRAHQRPRRSWAQ